MHVEHVLQLLAAVCVLSATGCSTTVFYNPGLVAQRIQQVGAPAPGRVLIYTTPEQDAYVYRGRPTTFIGSAVTAQIPFGRMTHEIAVAAFDGAFSQGAVTGSSLDRPVDYEVILIPSVTEFDYHYRPQAGSMLKSVADIRMKLRGKVLTPNADVLMDKVYDSNRVASEGSAGYVPKMLNKVAHTTLCDLMSEFARDVKLMVLQQSRSTPASSYRTSTPPSRATIAPVHPPAPDHTTPPPSVDPRLVPERIPATLVPDGY